MIGQIESGVHPWTNQYSLQGEIDKASVTCPVLWWVGQPSWTNYVEFISAPPHPHNKKNVVARSE